MNDTEMNGGNKPPGRLRRAIALPKIVTKTKLDKTSPKLKNEDCLLSCFAGGLSN